MMKTKTNKRVLKDLEAIMRVKQIMLDPARNAEMKQFVLENSMCSTTNVYIKNSTVNIGGK